eukprot:12898105-Prorocentrum_lima.AAC.1
MSATAYQRTDVTKQSFVRSPNVSCFLQVAVGLLIFETCSTHVAVSPDQAWMLGGFYPCWQLIKLGTLWVLHNKVSSTA